MPHYPVIEETAHELGKHVSRMVQAMHLNEVLADYPPFASCPTCKTHRAKERDSAASTVTFRTTAGVSWRASNPSVSRATIKS